MDFLNDRTFLLKVNQHKVREYHAAIMCLDFETENPLARFEGKVISGSISVAANSPTRRTGSMQIIFDKTTYNITDVLNLIAIDKKVSISLGITNPFYHTQEYRQYGDILWFKQGVFVLTQASSQISTSGLTVSINFVDKMGLLDGTCGGKLPASVSFHEAIVVDGEENVTIEHPIIRDIIQNLVHHFGNEHPERISIEDVPTVGRIVVQYIGDTPINFATIKDENSPTGYIRAAGGAFVVDTPPVPNFEEVYIKGDNLGYKETPLTYPGELIHKAGSTVQAVLNDIVKVLGNYEYFYDVEGVFHFRQKNNFLATGNTPLNLSASEDAALQATYCPRYSPTLLVNEFLDTSLVTNINFNPNYANIKNDFVYWGSRQDDKKNDILVRYHLAIDKRPEDIPIPTTDDEWAAVGDNYSLCHKNIAEVRNVTDNLIVRYQVTNQGLNYGEKWGEEVAPALDVCFPENKNAWFNWREELYRRALMAYGTSQDGSYYDEELMAEWRNLFDPTSTIKKKGKDSFQKGWEDKYMAGSNNPWYGYKVDVLANPEKIRYWLDFIDTAAPIGKYSVNRIGRRTVVTEDSKINEVFSREINDIVFIEMPSREDEWQMIWDRVKNEYIPIGQTYAFVQPEIWKYFKEKNSYGTCYEGVRQQMYENLIYNSSVNLTAIPILYLDVNQAVRLNFAEFGVTGDYIINSINWQFGAQTMTLGLQEALVIN